VTGSQNRERYLDRGITMYGPWVDDFVAFDMWVKENLGERPEGCSLDRINNEGNYEPGNLRWATPKEQCNNKSANVWVAYRGETRTVAEWERFLGLNAETLRQRIFKYNWPVERALTTPSKKETTRELKLHRHNARPT
jgi:hypothetical protein